MAPEDCDDADASVHPGASDPCGDGLDQDCDGVDPTCGFAGTRSLADADILLTGDRTNDGAGWTLDAGDLSGDGVADLVVGALYHERYGTLYMVSGPVTGSLALEDGAFELEGSLDRWGAGRSIGVGDVNGDGLLDLLAGAPYAAPPGVGILYGPITEDRALSSADAWLQGDGSYTGHGADLADVTGDGLADAVVGAYMADDAAGQVLVKHAPLDPYVLLSSDADATLLGEARGDYVGHRLELGGDLDGDGVADLLVPAIGSSLGAPYGGAVYLLYGTVSGTVSLADSDAWIAADATSHTVGEAMAQGDVDGDGRDDLAIGGGAGGTPGFVWVFSGPVTGTLSTAEATATVTGGTINDFLGSKVTVQDVDGDGVCDVLAGAPAESSGGFMSGAAYLFPGPLLGTSTVDDALATFLGDTSGGNAGSDVLAVDGEPTTLWVAAPMDGAGLVAGFWGR